MAYSDQKFYVRPLLLWGQAVSFGTATASSTTGHNVTDSVKQLPNFKRRCVVNKLYLHCTTIPDTGSTALKASFLNGTTTFGTVILTTATADQELTVTIDTDYNVISSGVQPTVTITGTATASADVAGSYDIWAEVQELPESA